MKFRKKKSIESRENFTLNFWNVYTKLIEFQNPDKIVWRNRKNAIFEILLFSDKVFSLSFCNLLYHNCTFMHHIQMNNSLES